MLVTVSVVSPQTQLVLLHRAREPDIVDMTTSETIPQHLPASTPLEAYRLKCLALHVVGMYSRCMAERNYWREATD